MNRDREEHLNSAFLTGVTMRMIRGEEITEERKERLRSHLPDCQECGRRLVEVLRIIGGETGVSLLGLDVVTVRWGATVTPLSADAEVRDIFAECIRRYA